MQDTRKTWLRRGAEERKPRRHAEEEGTQHSDRPCSGSQGNPDGNTILDHSTIRALTFRVRMNGMASEIFYIIPRFERLTNWERVRHRSRRFQASMGERMGEKNHHRI